MGLLPLPVPLRLRLRLRRLTVTDRHCDCDCVGSLSAAPPTHHTHANGTTHSMHPRATPTPPTRANPPRAARPPRPLASTASASSSTGGMSEAPPSDAIQRVVTLDVTTNYEFYRFECVGVFESGNMRLLTIEVQCSDASDPAPQGRFGGYVFRCFGDRLQDDDGATMIRTIEKDGQRWTVWGITSASNPTRDLHPNHRTRAKSDESVTLQSRLERYSEDLAGCASDVMQVATALLCA